MLPGPILRREWKAATRRGHLFMVRTFLGLLLAAPAVVAGFGFLGSAGLTNGIYQRQQLWTFNGSVFITVLVIEMVFVMPLALTNVGPAVAEEREKDTLSLLLLTSLTPVDIIVTKLIGRLIPSLLRRFDEWVGRPHRQPHAESTVTSTAVKKASIKPSLQSFLERTT
jgi:hypothetical protein